MIPNSKILFSVASVLMMIFVPGWTGALTSEEINNIEIYKRTSPGVVNITSVVVRYDFFYKPVPQAGTGSGAIIDPRGYIITNYHVIHDAKKLEVTLADGSTWPAQLVGADPKKDLAVIKIDAPKEKLSVLPFGSSKGLRVGDKVLAIGNPFGLQQTMTAGIISSLGRSIQSGSDSIIENVIQTDAAVNPGNSGGPLLNSQGEIIGINAAIISPTGASVGVGFAIPVDDVKEALPSLMQGWMYALRPLYFLGLGLLVFLVLRWMGSRLRERPS
ncbi:MAG: trypsin-like peptidase domain-containing protein [Deltaproteobacteria bacterium]|nr:trypsin-like peptidase domain-containing protein [Deltaproteobacteria bacterium]MBW2307638.1 trypsin-like peptidase domain-containing protein [Deltaproteobacteria bacterium]